MLIPSTMQAPAHSNVQFHLVHPSPLPLSCLELYGRRRVVRFCSATLERSPPPRWYIIIPPFTIDNSGQLKISATPLDYETQPGKEAVVVIMGRGQQRQNGQHHRDHYRDRRMHQRRRAALRAQQASRNVGIRHQPPHNVAYPPDALRYVHHRLQPAIPGVWQWRELDSRKRGRNGPLPYD